MRNSPGAAPQETTRPLSDRNGQRGVIELARIAVEDVIRLIQQEIRLAKVEIREMLTSNLKAAMFLSAAAFCALLFFVLGLVTIALVIPAHALVAAIETGIVLIAAIVLGLLGKRMLKIGPPEKTMTSLKEDAEWARHLLKRNGK